MMFRMGRGEWNTGIGDELDFDGERKLWCR